MVEGRTPEAEAGLGASGDTGLVKQDPAPKTTPGSRFDGYLEVVGHIKRVLVPETAKQLANAIKVVTFGRIRAALFSMSFALGALAAGAVLAVLTHMGASIGSPLAVTIMMVSGWLFAALANASATIRGKFTTPELDAIQDAKSVAVAEYDAIDRYAESSRRDGGLPPDVAAEVKTRRRAALRKELGVINQARPRLPASPRSPQPDPKLPEK